jgi:hypothetical protein
MVMLAVLAVSLVPALAGEVENLARDAEAKAKAGDTVAAVETLRRAIGVVMTQGPLTLRKVQFIAEPPKGFGIYKTRADNVQARRATDHLCRATRHGLENGERRQSRAGRRRL